MDILDTIGNTPSVDLKKVIPTNCARVVVKLEWTNPTGSMKDRMARAAIEGAEKSGKLNTHGTVVEYTGGTTGVSLAFVCAAKRYPLKIMFSDAFSAEKERMMRAYGAEITVIPFFNRGITGDLIKEMIEKARIISQQPEHWWSDPFNNRDALTGYYPLGEEIWKQTSGEVNAFVHAVGTAHFIH
jgi:cysteine synthase A